MAHQRSLPAYVRSAILPLGTGLLAIGIFVVDTFVLQPNAVAALYVVVVLLSVTFLSWRGVLLVSLGSAALAILGYVLQHGASDAGDPLVRLLVSLLAIGTASFLALKSRAGAAVLGEQARLLDLTHDTIFVRNMEDIITYWNRGAEEQYGWESDQARGKVSHQLMQTIFPVPLEEINAELLRTGRWEGELVHARRQGPSLVVASRWSLQRDKRGRPTAILETNNDITDRKQAEDALRESEQRFRDYAETASDWFWETGPDHSYTRVSEQRSSIRIPALRIGAARWDLATDLDEEPEKWRLHVSILEALKPFRDFRYRAKAVDGSVVYVATSGKPVFDPNGRFLGYRGVSSDVTTAVRAEQVEEALHKTQVELAHVTRVTTLGELAASIAHEVNQPLAAIVTNGEVCLRLLDREVPDLAEVREALGDMISNGRRASDIIQRLRALTRRNETQKVSLDINSAISEVIPLVQHEVLCHGVSLRLELEPALPKVLGDRVQLQQVILNLVVNGIEAMAAVADGPRNLVVRSHLDETGQVIIGVQDSGVGIEPENAKQLFNAFYTTKSSGMGMGLSICRSIIENHDGTLSASRNAGSGATFQFTLPSRHEAPSQSGASGGNRR